MKIRRIEKVSPTPAIPAHHLKWCGLEVPPEAPRRELPPVSLGDLMLYNKWGKIVVHTSPPICEK